LTCVNRISKLTPMMVKTQVYLPEDQLRALHRAAKRSGKSVAQLVREAVRRSCLPASAKGPVGLWDGELRATSFDHDSVYDNP
jgi:hypothetical protein